MAKYIAGAKPPFTDTITVYNHYKQGNEDRWQRNVLNACQWTERQKETVSTDGKIVCSQEVTVSILGRTGYEKKHTGGTNFSFGLDNLDLVINGECSLEIDEETSITTLRKNHSAKTIVGLTDNTGIGRRLKYWRISAI